MSPKGGNTRLASSSSYQSSKHNILEKVQSQKDMDLSNLLFNEESELEMEFMNNIQALTNKGKQVQINEEDESGSQEVQHHSSMKKDTSSNFLQEIGDYDEEIQKKLALIDQLKKTYIRFEEEENHLKD